MKKVTTKQYKDFKMEFHQPQSDLKGQRYGQAFCNKFEITDSTLFYEADTKKASQLIKTNYIQD